MKILDVTLQTHRLAELKAFYTQVLELPLAEEKAAAFAVQVQHTRLRFRQAAAGEEPQYHFAFNIPENQLAQARAWVAARVPLLRSADGTEEFDFANWHAHAFYFEDPAGNILECIARHDLPNATSAPFSGASLLGLSEVGLPVADVLAFCGQLTAQLGVPSFAKGTPTAHFSAMGDDEGLLIVVPLEKKWMPTDKPVQACPVEVVLALPAAAGASLQERAAFVQAVGN